ncbi:MAG: hypothetical protein K1X57_08460 [Gemmataceae bacterium]|nr:hypothetical protein [Gemmataceae bacterium]
MAKPRRRVFRRMLNLEQFEGRIAPAVFTVTNLNSFGPGSLRQAVLDSNNSVGADTIDFQASLTGMLNINAGLSSPNGIHIDGDGLLIRGPGADKLTITAGGLSRLFDTKFSPAGTSITLRDLTLTGGYAKFLNAASVDQNGQGGAVFVEDEAFTLDRCVVTGNTADKSGGGLALGFEATLGTTGGTINVFASTISNNFALEGNGGGIAVTGELTGGREQSLIIRESTISGNTGNWTPFDGSQHVGGGIAFLGKIRGVYGFAIRNSTITNNLAKNGVFGGGIGTLDLNGTLILNNVTISHNQSTAVNTAGIRIDSSGSTNFAQVSLFSSVIANNTNANGNNSNLNDVSCMFTTLWNGDNNLIGVVGSGNSLFTGKNNQLGTQASPLDAKLGPLQANGGRVQTRMPLLGSPLIANGLTNNEPFDTRGIGYPRILDGAPDIGAIEFADWIVRSSADKGAGSLRQLITDAEAFTGPNTITFDPAVFNVARNIPWSGEMNLNEPLTVTGPSGSNVTLTSIGGFRHFNLGSANTGDPFAFSGITFKSGSTTGNGGSILVGDQNLSLVDCRFENNTAAAGAAVWIGKGQLSVQRCTFAKNNASVSGGAIAAESCQKLEVFDSTFSDNIANGSGNTQGGGAIVISGSVPSSVVRSSTFATNRTNGQGGALFVTSFTGTLTVQNSTIAYNSASGTFGGGGVSRVAGLAGDIALTSCIVSSNVHTAGANEDTYSALGVYATNSAVGVPGVGGLIADATSNALVGQNFKLGALANNGGTTQTILPAFDSPVRDNGSNPAGLTLDQRGQPRISSARADIGAVELPPDFVVRNTADSGAGSLRQQIIDANTVVGSNTVTFDSAFFASPRTITLAGTPMTISENVTIAGPGASLATIDAAGLSRALTISGGLNVTISDLTLTGGRDSGGAIIRSGNGTLTLNSMAITGNTVVPGAGSPISVIGGSVVVNDSTLTGNSGAFGGTIGVYPAGSLVLNRTTVSGNTAQFRGGGIYVMGTVSIANSTISGNQTVDKSVGEGGGLCLNLTGSAAIRNSTISSNIAAGYGGGVAFIFGAGVLAVDNSTVANNSGKNGGGFGRASGNSTLAGQSSIISSNSSSFGAPDISIGGTVTLADCLLGSSSGIGTLNALGTTSSLIGLPAKLGPLASNGGATLTHALLPGSPAINNGNNSGALVTDQRGGNFARVVGAKTDIGAFESELAPSVASVVINGGTSQRSRVTQIEVNFDQVVTFAGTPAGAFQLTRQLGGTTVGLSAVVANTTTTKVTLTFLAGSAVESKSLADGRYTLVIDNTKVSAGGKALDGNTDGNTGGNYTLVGQPPNGLFRLFGDTDGNGTVDSADFLAFRLAFLSTSPAFDFDGNGSVDSGDFLQFRLRFLQSV